MSPRVNPRLADAESPYLEEAAEQPVDWYPFGDEAFERARKEDKPVLVDSGAVWCHWCHVMDHESYEDAETAELINERFVPVKLDRDERPDVDKRLQQAVGAITGRGGWPLTAFLTPDGEVFYGGTYFPREPRGGMPAFQQVLTQVAELYEEEPDKAHEQASKIQDALQRAGPSPGEVSAEQVEEAVEQALGAYDPVHGGFGRQPKFPHTSTVELLLAHAATGDTGSAATAREAATHTLAAMAEGGIHDPLDGGFHRYSVDAEWHVPHFEKMLYDNGPLAGTYAQASAIALAQDRAHGQAALLEATARDTAGFMLETLEQPEGGFGGSMDADRRPEDVDGPLGPEELDDGGYFTFSLEQARACLDEEELRVARLAFGIEEHGDVETDPEQNVLRVEARPEEIAEGTDASVEEIRATLERAREKLRQARHERRRPFVDPTVYTDWNGLAIAGLLRLDAHLEAPEARRAALAATDRLLEEAWVEDRGFHHALSEDGARVPDLVDDQVQMLPALVEAYTVTGEDAYREAARRVGHVLLDRFLRDDGRLRFNANDQAPAPEGDSPTPAPGAQAALHLPRVARITGEEAFEEAGDEILTAQAGRLADLGGVHGGTLALAMLARINEPAHVVVTGTGERAEQLREAAVRAPAALRTVLHADDPDAEGVPQTAREAAGAFGDEPRAIVCRGQACQVAGDPDELAALLSA